MSEIVFIGMDLGTSRTSITTSTGVRTTVWSYVGYAQDHISRKHLGGRDKVFGEEAVQNRMAVDLVRPLDKGVIQDDEKSRHAVRDLIEHVIEQAQIPTGSTIYGVIGAPAEASVDSKAHILSAASEFMDSIVVCSEPFSVAYGLDFLADTLVVDIGAGTVDLCRVHATMPKSEDQRTHHFGGDAIDTRLSELLTENHPEAQFSTNMIREIKEDHACVGSHMDPVVVSFPVKGKPTEFDITAEVSEACSAIVAPTVEALQDLIATYDPEFQQKMRNHILLGGGGSQINGLSRAFEEALVEYGGGKVKTVEEPQYAGSNGALKIALDMPEDFWQEFIEKQETQA
ncbi:MAG: rod shape-determining protein [Planctomycetota bacterium]|nr:rod shape-determining protein [Planctomycetota bacterium]